VLGNNTFQSDSLHPKSTFKSTVCSVVNTKQQRNENLLCMSVSKLTAKMRIDRGSSDLISTRLIVLFLVAAAVNW